MTKTNLETQLMYISFTLYGTACFHSLPLPVTFSYKLGLSSSPFLEHNFLRPLRTQLSPALRHNCCIVVSRVMHRQEQNSDINYLCTRDHVIAINTCITTCHRDTVLHWSANSSCLSTNLLYCCFIDRTIFALKIVAEI
jgi:hypothetical protein